MPRQLLGAIGLRGRIVGAVLVTAVAALAVAAVTLLGPLETKLRNAALTSLRTDAKYAAASFKNLKLWYIADLAKDDPRRADALAEQRALVKQQESLGQRIGAGVTLLGFPDAGSGRGHLLLPLPDYPDTAQADPFDDVAAAFRTGHQQHGFGTIEDTQYARVAIPLMIRAHRYVLAIRRPIDEVPAAVSTVRTAFLIAALVALALTVVLGIPLSVRIVHRLRVLRQAALRVAQEGPSVEVPVDRARDEVGDLTRTFRLMQAQLQQQEEARRAFVATASHELRTPLATLDGMLELLEDDLRSGDPDLEDAHSLLERARAQSHRLGRLAADLLDLSRIDAQVDLRSEPVELSELSRAVLAEFELGVSERQISTSLADATGPVWAMADPGSVARIVRILIDNAVQMSPDGSRISIELRNGERASLSVCDEGPGVSPDERELIFERFKRGRQTKAQAGFGLGLAIGRELAERMGGELVLEGQDGPGARFTLRLPVAKAPDAEPLGVA